ncbi:unnamed protein product [Closterium sp. NIES-54]
MLAIRSLWLHVLRICTCHLRSGVLQPLFVLASPFHLTTTRTSTCGSAFTDPSVVSHVLRCPSSNEPIRVHDAIKHEVHPITSELGYVVQLEDSHILLGRRPDISYFARYSSPATAALGRLILPYLFPELSAFATVEDLVTHIHTSDARYRAALPAEFLDRNPPPMYITLYFIVTRLPDSLRAVRDHFLALDPTYLTVDLLEEHLPAAKTSVVAVGADHGTPRTPFFEGCSPSPLAPSYAPAAAVDIIGAEDVGVPSALSGKRRSSKGKGGTSGGGGSGGGGGGGSGGGGGGGGGGSGGSGGGSGGFGGGGGVSGGGGGGGGGGSGSGGGGSGGGRGGAVQRGGSGGGQRQ